MKCPICKQPVPEQERQRKGSFYPFCSQRCKLIDLGRWLGGKYQIPVVEEDESRPDDQPPHRSPPGHE